MEIIEISDLDLESNNNWGKSSNFGGGLELLMNDRVKESKGSTSFGDDLDDISEDEDEVPLTSKVKSFINKTIADSKKDGEFEELK